MGNGWRSAGDDTSGPFAQAAKLLPKAGFYGGDNGWQHERDRHFIAFGQSGCISIQPRKKAYFQLSYATISAILWAI